MAQTSKTIHNCTTIIPDNGHDDITSNVVGHGDWIVGAGASLSFEYGVSVGGGQEIELSNKHADGVWGGSRLSIVDWADFHGKVDLSYKTPPAGAPAMEQSSIGLIMLTQAVDSFSYKNDLLKLWSGNQVVDTLKLDVHDQYGFTVQSQTTGGLVAISTNTPTLHGIDSVHGHSPDMMVHST